MCHPSIGHSLGSLARLLRTSASLFTVLFALGAAALAADPGRLSGTVTSKSTGNALQGATVQLPELNRSVLTDNTGSFTFFDVPAGDVKVSVSYSGFEDQSQQVLVASGATAQLPFEMEASERIALEKFTVSAVKEGQALSVTEQRNAANIKNVVALDEWGVLPTQNVGELFTRLPGVSFTTDEDNLINNVTIRGLVASNGQSFTRLNIDGLSATGVGGNGRTATLHSFSAALYEQLEVIGAQTPDKRADAIGGQINLKTRSPLAMKEKRRFSYNLSGRYNPSTAKRNADFSDHPFGYVASVGYTEVFDVGSGQRNLGISVNAVQQQIVSQFDYDVQQYNASLASNTAYFRDYDKRSGLNHRFITGISTRADYRWSDTTTVSARFQYNAGSEPFFHYTFVNPFLSTNTTVYDPVSNPTGGIVAGSNSTRTEIRPVGNAQLLLTPRRFSFTSTNPTGTLNFEHDFGKLKVDHAWRYSRTHWDANSGRDREGGQVTLRTRDPIGFILDNSNLDGRVFTQTAGASVYDPASYASFVTTAANTSTAPVAQTSTRFDKRGIVTNTTEWSGSVNASYSFDTQVPIVLKAGVDTVNREIDNFQSDPRRWYAVAGTVLSGPLVPLTTFEENHGGQRLPVFDPAAISTQLNTPAWYEDVYFNAVQRLVSRRYLQESVDAGYIQGQAKFFNRLLVLGGVRLEKTDDETATFLNRTAANAGYVTTLVESDPYVRARRNAVRQTTHGSYSKLFPSAHLTYNITPSLLARASWSTSYSRPDLLQLVPGVTVNDTTQTVTIGNPDLKPQQAKNIELRLDYYSKSSGQVTLAVYRKRITDYLPSGVNFSSSGDTVPSTPDNGFDGLYGGYQIVRPRNIGAITLHGIEFNFSQRLIFLPGALKGLLVRGNYTYNTADGDLFFYTGQPSAIKRSTREIAGVLKHAANFGLQYTYGRFGASFDLNYTGEYADFNSATLNNNTLNLVQLLVYRKPLTTMNAGITYKVHPSATAYLNVNNFTQQGPDRYTYTTDRPRQHTIAPLSITFGITGQF